MIAHFEQFEAHLNAAILCDERGAAGAAAAFAPTFVISDEAGVRCGTNDAAFVAEITARCDSYRRVGTRSLRLEGIDSSPLDANHVTARAHWIGEFQRSDGTLLSVPFDTICFVRFDEGALQIIGYLPGTEREALRAHGIVL